MKRVIKRPSNPFFQVMKELVVTYPALSSSNFGTRAFVLCLGNHTTANGSFIKRQTQNLVKYINKNAIKNGLGQTCFQKLAQGRRIIQPYKKY